MVHLVGVQGDGNERDPLIEPEGRGRLECSTKTPDADEVRLTAKAKELGPGGEGEWDDEGVIMRESGPWST